MHDEHACLKTLKQMLNSEYLDTRKLSFFYLRIYKLHYLPEKDILLIAVQPAMFASSFRIGLMTGVDSF